MLQSMAELRQLSVLQEGQAQRVHTLFGNCDREQACQRGQLSVCALVDFDRVAVAQVGDAVVPRKRAGACGHGEGCDEQQRRPHPHLSPA